ncbi:NUDIX hydrolase [Haliangium ochraceum]|uniref:NUDIX hydrolase n=1 Tax=Haliangium ochraceum (strain DSM 14365 / JCM 11303 / SMP-2) TaxID=502025 RepID=D0LH77_HALO1|nr:NUDIX domain-containing protein [Haliangium ochraceum]ACY18222.1 NUDIX hydrolase [Haliangium ochraceum DSM 14365]
MPHTYEYPRPALSVDCVVFGHELDKGQLEVLLIRRRNPPFAHAWALPGGFVNMDETTEAAARRELAEETGVSDLYLEQLYTFSGVERDPRGRVVSVAYFALVKRSAHGIAAASDAEEVAWHGIDDLPALAFDHQAIVDMAVARLRAKVRYAPIAFALLPPKFTLSQLQRLYETILQETLDKRNFRKKMRNLACLVDTGELEEGVAHRKARLYRFDARRYRRLIEHGFSFAI